MLAAIFPNPPLSEESAVRQKIKFAEFKLKELESLLSFGWTDNWRLQGV